MGTRFSATATSVIGSTDWAGLEEPASFVTLCSPAPLPAYSHAFQPIVDIESRRVFSQEALVRGSAGEPAFTVLQQVPAELQGRFDRRSAPAALALAARLGLDCYLNLNFSPQSLTSSASPLEATLGEAARHAIAIDRIVLEVTEDAVITDHARFARLLGEYRALGLKVAIDDFGAGYSGLNLLAEFQPDQVKIDMNLVRGIERHGPRQAIVRAILQVCTDLGIDAIAEGVETPQEYRWFAQHGVHLFQGYLFAKPGFGFLPAAQFPPH